MGLEHYLFVFSWFKIQTLKKDQNENDFFHFLNLVQKGDFVLDIGANIGIMSYYLSKKVGSGKVIAFEPIPVNINALRRIIKYFDLSNVELMDMALGNYDGEVEMILPVVDNVTKQGLSHVVSEDIKQFNEGEHHFSPIYKLDSLSQIVKHPIRAIKMDVENFEFQVLQGGEQTLKLYKPVVYCELWDNENRQKCFEFMRGLGYSIQVLVSNKLVPFNDKSHNTQNFFFVFE